jgi:hypothetical protein
VHQQPPVAALSSEEDAAPKPTAFPERIMASYDDYGMPVGAYAEPESLTHQAWRVARAFAVYRLKPAAQKSLNRIKAGDWSWRRWLTLVKVLIVVWYWTVYWGERRVFNSSTRSCEWDLWETWVCLCIAFMSRSNSS